MEEAREESRQTPPANAASNGDEEAGCGFCLGLEVQGSEFRCQTSPSQTALVHALRNSTGRSVKEQSGVWGCPGTRLGCKGPSGRVRPQPARNTSTTTDLQMLRDCAHDDMIRNARLLVATHFSGFSHWAASFRIFMQRGLPDMGALRDYAGRCAGMYGCGPFRANNLIAAQPSEKYRLWGCPRAQGNLLDDTTTLVYAVCSLATVPVLQEMLHTKPDLAGRELLDALEAPLFMCSEGNTFQFLRRLPRDPGQFSDAVLRHVAAKVGPQPVLRSLFSRSPLPRRLHSNSLLGFIFRIL